MKTKLKRREGIIDYWERSVVLQYFGNKPFVLSLFISGFSMNMACINVGQTSYTQCKYNENDELGKCFE